MYTNIVFEDVIKYIQVMLIIKSNFIFQKKSNIVCSKCVYNLYIFMLRSFKEKTTSFDCHIKLSIQNCFLCSYLSTVKWIKSLD